MQIKATFFNIVLFFGYNITTGMNSQNTLTFENIEKDMETEKITWTSVKYYVFSECIDIYEPLKPGAQSYKDVKLDKKNNVLWIRFPLPSPPSSSLTDLKSKLDKRIIQEHPDTNKNYTTLKIRNSSTIPLNMGFCTATNDQNETFDLVTYFSKEYPWHHSKQLNTEYMLKSKNCAEILGYVGPTYLFNIKKIEVYDSFFGYLAETIEYIGPNEPFVYFTGTEKLFRATYYIISISIVLGALRIAKTVLNALPI